MSLAPPELINPMVDAVQDTSKGDTVTLICIARGYPRPSITWSPVRDTGSRQAISSSLSGETSVISALTITSVLVSDAATYTCTTRNNLGVGSVNVNLLVFGMSYTLL